MPMCSPPPTPYTFGRPPSGRSSPRAGRGIPHRRRTSASTRLRSERRSTISSRPGALEADGEIESRSPATAETIRVRFEREQPLGSHAVLFLADQCCCSRPNQDWCPNVNLFEDEALATRWAEEHGVDGRVVSLEEGTELGAVEWRPLVEGRMATAPPATAEPAREERS